MKFFLGILLAVLVAVASAEEGTKIFQPANVPVVTETEPATTNIRNKRGFVLSTYAAPVVDAAIPVAAPAIASPQVYTYSASVSPYHYSSYRTHGAYYPYAAYYPYPAYYL